MRYVSSPLTGMLGRPLLAPEIFQEAWQQVLLDRQTDPALVAELLLLPDEPALSEGLPQIDIDGHQAARNFLLRGSRPVTGRSLLELYHELADSGPYQFSAEAIGRRSLRNRCLETLLALPDPEIQQLCALQISTPAT